MLDADLLYTFKEDEKIHKEKSALLPCSFTHTHSLTFNEKKDVKLFVLDNVSYKCPKSKYFPYYHYYIGDY